MGDILGSHIQGAVLTESGFGPFFNKKELLPTADPDSPKSLG